MTVFNKSITAVIVTVCIASVAFGARTRGNQATKQAEAGRAKTEANATSAGSNNSGETTRQRGAVDAVIDTDSEAIAVLTAAKSCKALCLKATAMATGTGTLYGGFDPAGNLKIDTAVIDAANRLQANPSLNAETLVEQEIVQEGLNTKDVLECT